MDDEKWTRLAVLCYERLALERRIAGRIVSGPDYPTEIEERRAGLDEEIALVRASIESVALDAIDAGGGKLLTMEAGEVIARATFELAGRLLGARKGKP